MSIEPEVEQGEVLTGAELFHYLFEENRRQLHAAQRKIREYEELKATLGSITDRSRRYVLAPVCGGLGYFEAELCSTNNILVLLGDGWFVERSAKQAGEIASRRVDFLRRELKVLREEEKTLNERQELFLSEVPEADEAVTRIVQRKAQGLDMARTSTYDEKQPTASAGAATESTGSASTSGAFDPLPADLDPALTTFDEHDELTEDELIELERELGDRVEDDELVERLMTERMIAKKEKRVRAELARRAAAEAEAARRGGRASSASNAKEAGVSGVGNTLPMSSEKGKRVASAASALTATSTVKPPAVFRSPADIGASVSSSTTVINGSSSSRTVAAPSPSSAVLSSSVTAATSLPTEASVVTSTPQPSASSAASAQKAVEEEGEESTKEARKRVSFAEKTEVRDLETGEVRQSNLSPPRATPAATRASPLAAAIAASMASATAEPESAREETLVQQPSPPQPMRRTSVTVGEIQERNPAEETVPTLHPVVTGMPSQPVPRRKKKSLFQQEMEGD